MLWLDILLYFFCFDFPICSLLHHDKLIAFMIAIILKDEVVHFAALLLVLLGEHLRRYLVRAVDAWILRGLN